MASKDTSKTTASAPTTQAVASAPASTGVRVLTSKPLNADPENYSTSITDMLYSLFDLAIQELYSNLPDASVVITSSKVADYQCNSAMAISQVTFCDFCLCGRAVSRACPYPCRAATANRTDEFGRGYGCDTAALRYDSFQYGFSTAVGKFSSFILEIPGVAEARSKSEPASDC